MIRCSRKIVTSQADKILPRKLPSQMSHFARKRKYVRFSNLEPSEFAERSRDLAALTLIPVTFAGKSHMQLFFIIRKYCNESGVHQYPCRRGQFSGASSSRMVLQKPVTFSRTRAQNYNARIRRKVGKFF
jgi:hypothetical protein